MNCAKEEAMRRNIYGLSVLSVLLFASVSQATELSTVVPGSEPTTDREMAAGAAEDTLGACMARIPKEATIGQRMIAEQGCWRDQNEREPFESVPGARKIRGSQNG
jgi:hypothetical protein